MKCCNLTKAKAVANRAIKLKQPEVETTLTAQAKKRRMTAEVVKQVEVNRGYRKRKAEGELERKTRKTAKEEARDKLKETFKNTCFMLVARGDSAQGAQEAINSRLQQMGSKEQLEIGTTPTTVGDTQWKEEIQTKIAACQLRLHIIPVNFEEPTEGLRHEESYDLGNQRDACVTLVEWRQGDCVLFHDSLCIQRKRMEAHPIDERAEVRKQQKKESHLQQHIRKRKNAQIESIAKRRKLFTLIDGKIVRTESVQRDTERQSGSQESTKAKQTDPCEEPIEECPKRKEERVEEHNLEEEESDPLGLGFELD